MRSFCNFFPGTIPNPTLNPRPPLLLQAAGKDVSLHVHDEKSLLAVQGPLAAPAVQSLVKGVDLSKMYFSDFGVMKINGVECFLTRTG
jgi:aminomethyltransferase